MEEDHSCRDASRPLSFLPAFLPFLPPFVAKKPMRQAPDLTRQWLCLTRLARLSFRRRFLAFSRQPELLPSLFFSLFLFVLVAHVSPVAPKGEGANWLVDGVVEGCLFRSHSSSRMGLGGLVDLDSRTAVADAAAGAATYDCDSSSLLGCLSVVHPSVCLAFAILAAEMALRGKVSQMTAQLSVYLQSTAHPASSIQHPCLPPVHAGCCELQVLQAESALIHVGCPVLVADTGLGSNYQTVIAMGKRRAAAVHTTTTTTSSGVFPSRRLRRRANPVGAPFPPDLTIAASRRTSLS